ncbi:S-layer homology domain-containing protein [Bacillus benzoevorans]|uniref:SLH domain-containing protein n=1 Tax=Bacillus benzoevorans TaxID=1456 RepID=A0A7X0LX16_9BACI|nr:S-layer homology domain-containing protein [Bacillus benzoevorans]MBB6446052.1 hypothetical protein [Bacillus benzoevorans]
MAKSANSKKYIAAALSTVVAASVAAPAAANVQAAGFDDVAGGAFYYDAVTKLAGKGIINGFADKTFRPNQDVTRGQTAQILAGVLGLNGENAPDPGFKDVKKNNPFYKAIAALSNAGIINGVTKETFQPNKPITRAEMSRMLTTAFDLIENTTAASGFTDVPLDKWYAGCVGALVEKGITFGKSAKTFAPNEKVTRGQIASFIYRAQENLAETQVIESVTDTAVVIDGVAYQAAKALQSLFNAGNAAALTNAKIQFKADNGVITRVTSLDITKAGAAASGNIVLDGQGTVIDGNVTVAGDFITLKNLTVKGNLKIGSEVQNSFIADTLHVLGKTILTDAPIQTAGLSELANITFIDSVLKAVEVNKIVDLVTQGASSLQDVSVSADVHISAEDRSSIAKMTVKTGAAQVQINAAVDELIIDGTGGLTISGNATLGNVKIIKDAEVNLNVTGAVESLQLVNHAASLLLSIGTEVGKVILPEGSAAEKIIANFEKVKEYIGTIIEDTKQPKDMNEAEKEDPDEGLNEEQANANAPIDPADTIAPAAPSISFIGKDVAGGVVDLSDLKNGLKTRVSIPVTGETGAKAGDILKMQMVSEQGKPIVETYKLTQQDIARGYVDREMKTNALRNLLGGLLGDTLGSVMGGITKASIGQAAVTELVMSPGPVVTADTVIRADKAETETETVAAASLIVHEDGTADVIDANGQVVASGFLSDLLGGVTGVVKGVLNLIVGSNGIVNLDGILGTPVEELLDGTVNVVDGMVKLADGVLLTVIDGIVIGGVVNGLVSGAEDVIVKVQLIDQAGNHSPETKQVYKFKISEALPL